MIETERLVIRVPRVHERLAVLGLWFDAANERSDPNADPAQVRRWVYGTPWVVCERETGELVGDASLHFDTTFGDWELSYGFRRDRWGRGYASEAAQAVVLYAFETMRVARIVADVDPANAASRRILEKCGFVRVGELEDGRFFYVVRRFGVPARSVRGA